MASPMQDLVDLTGGDWAFLVKAVGGPQNVLRLKRGELKLTLEVVKMVLRCDASFDPASFIGSEWTPWRGPVDGNGLEGAIEQDERSLALKEIDWTQVRFEHYLNDGEKTIKGEEKLKRAIAAGHIRFGGNVLLSLWNDYKENKGNSVLEWIYRTHGIEFLDFLGLTLRDPGGNRSVLYLYRDGREWDWNCDWLGREWVARDLSGVPDSTSGSAT